MSQQGFLRNLDSEGEYKPYLGNSSDSPIGGFDFAFGTNYPLDPTIGYYSVSEVRYYYS